MRKDDTKSWWKNQSLPTVSNMNIQYSFLDSVPDLALDVYLLLQSTAVLADCDNML